MANIKPKRKITRNQCWHLDEIWQITCNHIIQLFLYLCYRILTLIKTESQSALKTNLTHYYLEILTNVKKVQFWQLNVIKPKF